MKSKNKITILIADDHAVVRQGLRMMLRTASDIEVIGEASNGLEAIELAGTLNPQVILMDIRMPKLSGIEAMRRIKTQFPHISIIILTGYHQDAYVVDAIGSGAGGYLLKDASRDLIVNTIRAVSSGGMIIEPELFNEALNRVSSSAGKQSSVNVESTRVLEKLTQRERSVLYLITNGQTNKQIGQALSINEDTVKKHVKSILGKMGVSDRTQAAVKAVRLGFADRFGEEQT